MQYKTAAAACRVCRSLRQPYVCGNEADRSGYFVLVTNVLSRMYHFKTKQRANKMWTKTVPVPQKAETQEATQHAKTYNAETSVENTNKNASRFPLLRKRRRQPMRQQNRRGTRKQQHTIKKMPPENKVAKNCTIDR